MTDDSDDRGADPPAVIHLPDDRQQAKQVTSGSEKRRRRHVRQTRYDDAELAEFDQRRRAKGLSAGAYTRLAALGDPGLRHQRGPGPEHVAALLDAMVSFARANSNLNQVARAANTLLLLAQERGSDRLADEARELQRSVDLLREQFAAPLAAIHAALDHWR